MAPGDCATERLLALRQVAHATGQQVEPALEAGEHRARRQQAAPRRGELDRQRQSVEARHDLGHGARVRVVEDEVRPD